MNHEIDIEWRTFQYDAMPADVSDDMRRVMKMAFFSGAKVYAKDVALEQIKKEILRIEWEIEAQFRLH